MEPELIAVCAVQVIVLAIVVAGIIIYLLRNLMCRSRHDVSTKTILITGCDSAFGWQLARHYDQLGFRVYAGCANPAGEGAVRLQAEASPRLQILPIDITSNSSLLVAAKTIKDQLPSCEKGLWALINAATHCVCGELQWQTWEHCQKQFDTNFVGVVKSIRTFMPLLKSGNGRIINVGSLAGQQNYPEPGLSIYSSTKHGIEGLSEALRFELARHGVYVSVIQPDVVTFEKYLLQRHHRNMNEMWDQMSPELRLENQDIFIAYHDRVAKEEIDINGLELASNILSIPHYLLHCFDDALLSKKPYDVYVAVPTCFTRFRIGLLSCLPSGWRQYFIQRKYKHHVANILKV